MTSRRSFLGLALGGRSGAQPPPPTLAVLSSTTIRTYNRRLPWDDVRQGWVLPPHASNVVVFFSGRYLVEKVSSGSPLAYDYEIVAGMEGVGDLVKPRVYPWPSPWHTYFEYDLPAITPAPVPT